MYVCIYLLYISMYKSITYTHTHTHTHVNQSSNKKKHAHNPLDVL